MGVAFYASQVEAKTDTALMRSEENKQAIVEIMKSIDDKFEILSGRTAETNQRLSRIEGKLGGL
jgi:hypothetical protein